MGAYGLPTFLVVPVVPRHPAALEDIEVQSGCLYSIRLEPRLVDHSLID